ncbi:Aquaporin-8 [Balamuthia mandrillaris]
MNIRVTLFCPFGSLPGCSQVRSMWLQITYKEEPQMAYIMPEQLDRVCRKVAPFIVELVGTFMFMLSIGLSVLSGGELAPFSIGATLMILVYSGGHISGGHFNPSVSLGVFLSGRGKLTWFYLVCFWCAQFTGAFLGALTYWAISYQTFSVTPGSGFNAGQAFAAEFFFSFLLINAVIQTATTRTQVGNSFYGLAIGFSITAGAVAVGQHMPISGGGFNPAVMTGAIIVNAIDRGGDKFEYVWVYWLGPFFASAVAGLLFRVTNRSEFVAEGDKSIDDEAFDGDVRNGMNDGLRKQLKNLNTKSKKSKKKNDFDDDKETSSDSSTSAEDQYVHSGEGQDSPILPCLVPFSKCPLVVQLLVQNGADVSAVGNNGSASDIALECQCVHIADYIDNEMLLYAFSFLTSVNDLLHVTHVCKHFRRIGSEPILWKPFLAKVAPSKLTATSNNDGQWKQIYLDHRKGLIEQREKRRKARAEQGLRPYVRPRDRTTSDYDFLVKLAIIGDLGVGKTSLATRMIDGTFTDTYQHQASPPDPTKELSPSTTGTLSAKLGAIVDNLAGQKTR